MKKVIALALVSVFAVGTMVAQTTEKKQDSKPKTEAKKDTTKKKEVKKVPATKKEETKK
ncbi:MAG TPA: hypothetical protein VII99_08205 [Bacteroidia bacterium]